MNNLFILQQKRDQSKYNDFIGEYYHFPKKYVKQLSKDNVRFIYYEPKKLVYFGFGKIANVFQDKLNENIFFARISEYIKFDSDVPFYDSNHIPREKGPGYNSQNAVRNILIDEFNSILLLGLELKVD